VRFPAQVFWLILTISIWLSFCIFIFPQAVSSFFGWKEETQNVPYLAIYILLSVPSILIEPIYYLRKMSDKLLTYTHWSQLVTLLLTTIIAIVSPNFESFIWLLLFIQLIKLIYLIIFVIKFENFALAWTQIGVFAIYSIPLIVQMTLGSAMDFIDGWFVTRYFDPSYFPVFRYGAREMPLSAMLFSALSLAMVPEILMQGKHTLAIKMRATKLMHRLFPLSVILMLLSPILFPIIYDATYKDSAFIFNIYLLILTSRVLLPQSFCMALHQHKVIVWSGVLEIIANLLLSYWWMQVWGVYGLAMATVVSYFIQKLILIVYNYHKNQIPLGHYIDIKYYLIYMTSLIIVFFITFNLMT